MTRMVGYLNAKQSVFLIRAAVLLSQFSLFYFKLNRLYQLGESRMRVTCMHVRRAVCVKCPVFHDLLVIFWSTQLKLGCAVTPASVACSE